MFHNAMAMQNVFVKGWLNNTYTFYAFLYFEEIISVVICICIPLQCVLCLIELSALTSPNHFCWYCVRVCIDFVLTIY
jgi:hypothetical protein